MVPAGPAAMAAAAQPGSAPNPGPNACPDGLSERCRSAEATRMDLHPRRLASAGLALVALAGLSTLSPASAADPVNGLKAEYFDATDLTGAPVATRVDSKIDFDW